MEKIKIKLFDKSLPLPKYHTDGSVGMDLCARETKTIKPGKLEYIPLNVAIKPPKGYWILMAARGGTHKKGIMLANSVGIFDEDFCGDNDEYHFAALNYTDKEVTIKKGERIAQLMLIKTTRAEIEQVDKMNNETRGKYGSTG
ncbi:dUTP diphosphatase [Patescibacteria group bacterium]